MMFYKWNKIVLWGVILTALVLIGCTDPVSEEDNSVLIDNRVLVYESTEAPPMDDPENTIWYDVTTGNIDLGDDEDYADFFGSKTLLVKMMKTADRLYARFEWVDNDRDRTPNYLYHTFVIDTVGEVDTIDTWAAQPSFIVTSTSGVADTSMMDQDRVAIIWDKGNNLGEQADCASMCHATPNILTGQKMYTTGTDSLGTVAAGTVDVWQWLSGTSDPILKARDEYWDANGHTNDAEVIPLRTYNFDDITNLPIYMHRDTFDFSDDILFASDTVPFDTSLGWPNGQIIPGHVLYENASGSVADIDAFAIHALSSSYGRWMVLMSRPLTTSDPSDIDFSTITSGDSIQVTVMIAENSDRLHSGSKPFYVVFP